MKSMYSPAFLSRHLSPHGFSSTVRIIHGLEKEIFPELLETAEKIVQEETWYEFEFLGFQQGSDSAIECRVRVPIPKSQNGVFFWGDRKRIAVWRCTQDLTVAPGKLAWKFTPGPIVILNQLQKAFAAGLRDFYFTGNPPSSATFRSRIGKIFSDSTVCPVVPMNSIGAKSLEELVYMELPETLDLVKLRFPEELFGILDPCSTSNGNKINKVYRLCQGVTIDKYGRAIPSKTDYCSTLADNAIGLDLVPHRVGSLRTTFESSLDLMNPEAPWVSGELHELQGIHLFTGLMEHKWNTWEDCIAISETAARRFKAQRICYEVIETFGPLEIKIKEDDIIMPGGHLIGLGLNRQGVRESYYARKIKHPSLVESITVCKTYLLGKPALRYRLKLVSTIETKTGDKITTRAGTKGVVMVIPDRQMPAFGSRTLDCCISPSSVIGRKAVLVAWEMMMNTRQAQKGGRMTYKHLDQLMGLRPSFGELVGEGFGSKVQLSIKGLPLACETFVGFLYCIRLDKIASEIATVQSGEKPLNHHDISIDNATLSGQRRDLAKALAMDAKGLKATLAAFIRQDTTGVKHVREIAGVLEPRYLKS